MLRTRFRRHRRLALALSLCVSCTSAFQVKTDGGDPKGLPFYLKSMVYRQHSTYEYAWLRLSLGQAPVPPTGTQGAEQTGPRTVMVRDVRDDDENRQRIARLQALVADLPAKAPSDLDKEIAKIREAFAAIPALPSTHTRAPGDANLRMTANYVERVPVVDYTKVYYLNGTIPPFGSNNLSAELAADGTLSKGATESTGGVGDAIGTIATAVTGLAPIKEFLTTKWVPTKSDSTDLANAKTFLPLAVRPLADPQTFSFRVDVAVESQALTFDFIQDGTRPTTGASLDPVKVNFTQGLYTVRGMDKSTETPAEDGIVFSGKVQLPTKKE